MSETEAHGKMAALEQALAEARERISDLEQQAAQGDGDGRSDAPAIRFQALFEHALDAILIADDEGRYVDANPAACALTGVSREELLGKTAADFGPRDIDFATVWQSFLDSEKEQGEFPIYRPDGSVRYAEYAAVPNILPGRHLSILRDVTARKQTERERRQAEEALRRSEARYRTLFETMVQGVVYHDLEGNIVEANTAVSRIFARSRDEIIALTPADLPPLIDEAGNPLPTDQLPARVALRTGQPVYDVIIGVYRPEEDDYHWVRANSIPQFHPGHSEPYQVYTTFEDITERKKREAERNQLLQQLQDLTATLEQRVESRTEALHQRSQQLGAVASALAVAEQRERERISQILHDDLQQLLHAAQLRLILLRSELAGENESVPESVTELERLNEQALKVTRSLTVELSPPVLEGEGLAEAFAWLAGHMEDRYGLHVEVTVEEIEPASSDLRELVFQMVRELLFNVVKHAGVEQAQLSVTHQDDHCHITVADAGSGFDPARLAEEHENAFGYGLYSIRERLALFGGTLQVEAERGAGTRIVLSLPCRGPVEAESGGKR